jgi:hypothetical protein
MIVICIRARRIDPGAHLTDTLPAQLQTYTKKQQDQTQVRQQPDSVHVLYRRIGQSKGANDDSCEQVTQNGRQLEVSK